MSRTRKYAKRRYRSKSRKRIRRRAKVTRGGGSCRGTYAGTIPQILSAIGWPQKPSFVSSVTRRSPPYV